MSNYKRSATIPKASIAANGDCTISAFANSDSSLAVSIADVTITVAVIDAVLGKIKFSSIPAGFGNLVVTAVQDVQWPDDGGVFVATPHPITLGEVEQITTNKNDLGHLKDEIEDADVGLIKRVNDLEAYADSKVDKVPSKGLSTNDYDDDAVNEVAKVADKVDKESGKGLSTNDYTDADKDEVAKVGNKVDKVVGKGLSTNDYTDDDKAEVAKVANKADKPAGADNAPHGRVILDANGKIPATVYDSVGGGSVPSDFLLTSPDHPDGIVNNKYLLGTNPDFRPAESRNFGLSEWVMIDPHLAIYIYDDKKRFKIKYIRHNNNYPTNAMVSYKVTSDFGNHKKYTSNSLFFGVTGDLVGDGYGLVNHFGKDAHMFNVDAKLNENDDSARFIVNLQDGQKVKHYAFTIDCNHKKDDSKKYTLRTPAISGVSLSTDTQAYNG